jgi:hypothetical protein
MKIYKYLLLAVVLPLMSVFCTGFETKADNAEEELKEFELIDYSIFWGGSGDEFVSFKYGDTVYTNVAAVPQNRMEFSLLTVEDTRGLKKIGYVLSGEDESYSIYEREGYEIDEYIVAIKHHEFVINPAFVFQATDKRLSMEISDVTPRGLMFRFESDTEYSIEYGDTFTLFERTDGVWKRVKTVENPASVTMVGHYVRHDEEMEPKKEDWRWRYSTLPPGDYLYHKDVSLRTDDGTNYRNGLWKEFSIK